MTMQAAEMVEAPGQLAERVSRLEGSHEEVGERLRSFTSSVDSLRLEMDRKFEAQNAAMTALGESIRAEMDRKFEAQNAQIEALRVAMDRKFEAQNAAITALGESIRAEMNARFAEQSAQLNGRLNVLTSAFIGAMVTQFAAIIGLAAVILPRL